MLSYAVATDPGEVRADDFWFALILCSIPAAMVIGAAWVTLDNTVWRIVLGVVLLVPSLALWGAIMLYAFAGFRIH